MVCWEAGSTLEADKGGRNIAFQDISLCICEYASKLIMYNRIVAFITEKTRLEPISSASMYID